MDDNPKDMSNRLPILAAEIRRAHADVQDAAKTAAEHAITAGHALIEAKALVAHGGWLPWLRENCALAERTAQLYMKIARSGHAPEVVSELGLKGAEKALILEYCFYQPLYDGSSEARWEWQAFGLYLVAQGMATSDVLQHLDWIGRREFKTPDEWLSDGMVWARRWGMRFGDHREAWQAFRTSLDGKTLDDLEAELTRLAEVEPEPQRRRRRKSATVADLAGRARARQGAGQHT